MAKKGLGSGLDALFGGKPVLDDIPAVKIEKTAAAPEISGEKIAFIALTKIKANPHQPRRSFAEDKLNELATSIKEQGVLQPILVRPKGKSYEIVAGERRYRAAKQAGLKELPCIVRELDDNSTLEIALIENIQRQNLDPLEEAASYQELLERFSYTQQALAERLGKSRVHITNTMRLLGLPKAVRELIADGKLSAGHGRAILQLEDEADRVLLAEKIIAEGLSVRQAEAIAKDPTTLHGKKAAAANKPKKAAEPDLILKAVGEKLRTKLGTKITVQKTGSKKGRIQIDYANDDELQRLIDILLPGEEF